MHMCSYFLISYFLSYFQTTGLVGLAVSHNPHEVNVFLDFVLLFIAILYNSIFFHIQIKYFVCHCVF